MRYLFMIVLVLGLSSTADAKYDRLEYLKYKLDKIASNCSVDQAKQFEKYFSSINVKMLSNYDRVEVYNKLVDTYNTLCDKDYFECYQSADVLAKIEYEFVYSLYLLDASNDRLKWILDFSRYSGRCLR